MHHDHFEGSTFQHYYFSHLIQMSGRQRSLRELGPITWAHLAGTPLGKRPLERHLCLSQKEVLWVLGAWVANSLKIHVPFISYGL